MSNRNCPVCGATWISDQLYWSGTGKPGKDLDLAALVCNRLTAEKVEGCVNPAKGKEGGVGWEERMSMVEAVLSEFNL